MRKLIFENLIRTPITEAPPAADDAALAELAANVDRAARRRLGRSLAIREVDAGFATVASWKFMRSITRSTISNGSDCVSWPRRATPTCSW